MSGEDPLARLGRLSGPVSVFAFDVPCGKGRDGSNRVYVLGDAHFSYANACERCAPPECLDAIGFIDAHLERAVRDGTSFDVFLEMPYVQARGSRRGRVVGAADALLRRDAAFETRFKAALGLDPAVIGVFSALYRRYGRWLYHGRGGEERPPGDGNVRFHYADARSEPHVRAAFEELTGVSMLPAARATSSPSASRTGPRDVARFYDRVRTADDVRALLAAFVFSEDFVADWRRALGPDARVRADALSVSSPAAAGQGETRDKDRGKLVTKVSKQFWALRPDLRALVRAHFDERLDAVRRVLAEDVGYEDAARFMREALVARHHHRRASTPPGDHDDPLIGAVARAARAGRRSAYLHTMQRNGLGVAMFALVMDAYLLCRMLRYAKAHPGGTTVVYVGDAHAHLYRDFLRRRMRLAPVLCSEMRGAAGGEEGGAIASSDEISRCVDVARARGRRACTQRR